VSVAADRRINTNLTLDAQTTLKPGDSFATPRSFVAVYHGDFYEPLRTYSLALQREGWTVAKPILRGELALAEHVRLTEGFEHRRDLFAAIPSSSRTELRVRSEDGDFADLELSGFAAEALAELRDLDSAEARDALGLLLRLSGGGSR